VLIPKNVIYFPDYFDHEEHEGLEDILLVPTQLVGTRKHFFLRAFVVNFYVFMGLMSIWPLTPHP
jgi:hypothetical protein